MWKRLVTMNEKALRGFLPIYTPSLPPLLPPPLPLASLCSFALNQLRSFLFLACNTCIAHLRPVRLTLSFFGWSSIGFFLLESLFCWTKLWSRDFLLEATSAAHALKGHLSFFIMETSSQSTLPNGRLLVAHCCRDGCRPYILRLKAELPCN